MSSLISRHKQDWDELERLVAQARRWGRRLSSAERERLDELYRRTTIHLARASTVGGAQALTDYLNSLTAAAHSVIYLPPREPLVRRIARFVVEGFPRAIARHWRQHLASALLVLIGGLIGFVAASADPIVAHALWPPQDERQPGSTPEQLLAVLRHGRDQASGEKFLFASFLFQHNLKVSFLALATGVLAAVPTVLLMIFNGMLLGVFAAIHHNVGIRAEMWAWILPHGVTEFGATILCGGVGLMLGRAIVRPGERSRNQSLLDAGRDAARICVGAGGMLILAALIESYVRQSHWSTPTRFWFAGATAFWWALYIAYGFLRERQQQNSAPAALTAPTLTQSLTTAGSAAVAQRID